MNHRRGKPDQIAVTARRYEFARRATWTFAIVVVSVVLGLLLTTILLIRNTQKTGSPILKAVAAQNVQIKRAANASVATNQQLLDCLRPSGKCFRRSQHQTGRIVTGISRNTAAVIAAALSCQADGITKPQPLIACTVHRTPLAKP